MLKRFLTLTIVCLQINNLQAIFPSNAFTLGNTNQHTKFDSDNNWSLSALGEGTLENNGYNADGTKVDVLQIWQSDQSGLAMLRGFESTTKIGKLAAQLNSANDDGTRGHLTPTGKLSAYKLNFGIQYKLPLDLKLNLFVPVLGIKLKDINWVDKTKSITFTDQQTKTDLTDAFVANVKTLGDGLNIGDNWSKTGLGDAELTASWNKSFKQPKPILKNVNLGLYGGFSLPTGVRRDEDVLMPIAFGNDGSLGMIFGGNIQLQWWQHLRGGVDANFIELFGTTRNRRIKTDNDQTDLVLLAKTETRKEWGFTQQYKLYLEGYNLFDMVSVQASYNYIKHNQDKLSIFNQSYSSAIANTATSLQEWTQHNVMFSIAYEGEVSAQLYYKQPFNGKSVIQSKIVGGSLGINF